MDFKNVTMFQMMKARMHWLSQRQEVLSENVANADTPNFKSRDLKGLDFKAELRQSSADRPVMVSTTNDKHMTGPQRAEQSFRSVKERLPYETSPDGNAVVLEEQMKKISETTINHKLTNELYKKHLAMLRSALGR